MSVPDLSRPLGRYKLVRLLGEGNMGKVYRALDTRLERDVALKVPSFSPNDEAAIKRFHREAHSAALVNHPNICPVYDVEEINGVHFLTMPLLEGELLSNLVGPGKLWDLRKAVELVKTLALAMDEMHKKGLMHRDLKPANIMVRTRDKVPIIMDMGLARSYLSDLEMITVQGQKIGTPAYMSPEQVRGDVHMTHSCDIYSLGIILYQLLTGKVPFVGKPGHIYTHILNTPADPPSSLRNDIPKALDGICLRTLQKNPEDRFGTMAEFAQYLDHFLQSTTPKEPSDGRGNRDLEARLQQALQMLQQRNDQLAALTQAATAKGERLLALEGQYRSLEQQAQAAQGEVDMTRKMWATAERKYQEQLTALKQSGGVPSEEARREMEKVKEQLQAKASEIEMLKNFWQATERQYQFKLEDLARQMRQAQEELVMVRQRQGGDAALKQKYEALERELQTLKTQHQGQLEQAALAADQVRTELELEREAKKSFEERLTALQSESVMIKRLWEHRESQLADDLAHAQEDVRRLSQQQGVPAQKLIDAERLAREAQEQLESERQQRAALDAQRQELEDRLAQVDARLQTSASEAEMIKRMWSATEKNYQEQIARLQEDLLRVQKAPGADKERFEKLTHQLAETQAQLAHNEETLHLLQDEQAAALEKLEAKTKEAQTAKEAATREQQRREVLARKLGEMENTLDKVRAQLEVAEKARGDEAEQRARREERLKELEAQLALSQADHQSWQQRLETARATEDELRQKLQASTEATGQISALQQRLRALQEELAQEQEFRRHAEEEIIRIASASQAETDAKAKVVELQERLAQESHLRDELQGQLDQLRLDVEKFQATATQEAGQLADLEAKLAQEQQRRTELEEQAQRLRQDLQAEQESVDVLIQTERSRYRELEDEYTQTRQRLEQELAQVREQATAAPAEAASGVDPQLLAAQEEKVHALQTQMRLLQEQLDHAQEAEAQRQKLQEEMARQREQVDALQKQLTLAQSAATEVKSLQEEVARQREQQAAAERLLEEAQARTEELQRQVAASSQASSQAGVGDEQLRQLQQQWEQEKELRQEADDRAREAIEVAADLRRRLRHVEEELERQRDRAGVPDQRVRDLEQQVQQFREKLMAADYAQKDAEMKLGFLQRRMDTVDELAAADTRRRVEAERRQREAEVALEEERRLRQAADRRLHDLNDRVQQAQQQLDQAARSVTNEKHSRVLVEQEVNRLRTLLEAQQAAPGTPPAGIQVPTPRSGQVKRPAPEQLKPRKATPPPLPAAEGAGDDGPTQEMKELPQPSRPKPDSGAHNVRVAPGRHTPEGTAIPRVQVELRGSWYCRPMDDSAAKWSKVAETPAQVQVKPGEIYFLKVANVVTDAELVLLNALRQVPSLHTLSLSGCPEVSDHGLIHLRTLGQLQALNLASSPNITDTGLAHLRGLGRLNILSLASCAGITDAGMNHVGHLTNLQTLYLTGCPQITDQGITPLRRLANLETLFLDGCTQITDGALEVIGTLANLHALNFDRCARITDRGLFHLRNLANLTTLSLDRCEQISDAGLLQLRDLENLQSLSLSYCPRVTQVGLNHLQHLTKLQTISFAGGQQRPAKVT